MSPPGSGKRLLMIGLGHLGIRVLEVLPGPIDTDMLAASDRLPEAAAHAGYEALAEALLTGRRAVAPMTASPESAARAIADAILALLRDPDRARRMGATGRERVEREFSWPSVAKRTEAAYIQAMTRSRAAAGE